MWLADTSTASLILATNPFMTTRSYPAAVLCRPQTWVVLLPLVFLGACATTSAEDILAEACAAGDQDSCAATAFLDAPSELSGFNSLDTPGVGGSDRVIQPPIDRADVIDPQADIQASRWPYNTGYRGYRDDSWRYRDYRAGWPRYGGYFPGVGVSAGIASGSYGGTRTGVGIGLTL